MVERIRGSDTDLIINLTAGPGGRFIPSDDEPAKAAPGTVLTTPGSAFTASMLRDIEQGSRIESDHIVGDLLERAPSAVPAPLLSTAYAHLRAYEARRKRESGSKADS